MMEQKIFIHLNKKEWDMLKNYFALVVILCASFLQAASSSLAKVDAITAATVNRSCKFSTPTVTTTTATIKWTESHSNGTATFSYGTDPTKLTTRAVTASERSAKTIVLNGLTPTTTYSMQYLVSTSGETPYEASGTFVTAASSAVLPQSDAAKSAPLEFFDHSVRLGDMSAGDHLLVFDGKGRTLLSYYVTPNEATITLPSQLKGVVFLKYSRKGAVLDNRKVTIVR
jgi:hypothetical protein